MPSSKIPLFPVLEIETISTCNRVCPTCIRNSHPDRAAVADWFSVNKMPIETISELCRQAAAMDFHGAVCLSHYNEPLMDDRLVAIAKTVLAGLPGSEVFFHSNGDLLTNEIASTLDGLVDRICFSLYMGEPKKTERREWIRCQFRETRLSFTDGSHMATHFSPGFPVAAMAAEHSDKPCTLPLERMILNHRGQMLLCCEDVIGNFNLGRFPDTSLRDLWFGPRHAEYVQQLRSAGGRSVHHYCSQCPRP